MGHVRSLQNSWGKHGFLMSCFKADVLLPTVKLKILNPTKTPDKSTLVCVLAFSHLCLCVSIFIYIQMYMHMYVSLYMCVCLS